MIAFRADASFEIGSGHLMRCLTLADELARRGNQCLFIVRCQPGDHSQVVLERGHELLLMPRLTNDGAGHMDSGLDHAHWLVGGQDRDADDFVEALQGRNPDWIIVDHYGIDRHWEDRARNCCLRVMAIDDLADREHHCELLLDQNFGRNCDAYSRLVPASVTVLCGPRFALLRREFSEWRNYSIQRRLKANGHRLLINLGGVDQNNVTGQVLEALSRCPGAEVFDISVVMGANSPCLESVEVQVRQLDLKAELLTGISNMAEVMASSDLAIGAAGATSWERCCLGLPTLLLVIAENQKPVATALAEHGAALCIFNPDCISAQLCESLFMLSDQRAAFTESSMALCDGDGAARVADHLQEASGG
nr:UDP-2,4-diacetamido-2,4,6-trideoxy-beta-L-altropyranose hydrolase [Marinobacter sp. ATCH36]